MGHEFTGRVSSVGSSVRNFKEGDLIVSPFTVSCGECFYCKEGYSSRCAKSLLFGSAVLDGGQAEYVRVPLADATAMKAPEGIQESALVLMADIFPTGYFAAKNAFKEFSSAQAEGATVILLGLGPVGLCALLNILDFKPKHLFAVDSVESRLDLAKSLGAEPWNFMTNKEGLEKRVKEVTGGRGADIVVEVVGLSPALKLGFELLRPWGVMSSVGVHNGEVSTFFLFCYSFPSTSFFFSPLQSLTLPITDPLDRQPSIRQEPAHTNGQMSRPLHLPRGFGEAQAEAG